MTEPSATIPDLQSPPDTQWQGTRVLVTGGLGFVGSNLVHRLVALGASVTIVDALIPGHGGNRANIAGVESAVRVVIGDLRDRPLMGDIVTGQEVIFNWSGPLIPDQRASQPFPASAQAASNSTGGR